MVSIQVQLHRPFDREPNDHVYGEPFDSAADRVIGGKEKWSSPRAQRHETPRAVIPGTEMSIELHEDGPLLEFVLQNVAQIPNYVSAIAAVVSAWAATRALRKQQLPKDDFMGQGGTVVRMGDLRIESERNLEPDELARLLSAVAATRADREKPTS
jgi:hypothetical protein